MAPALHPGASRLARVARSLSLAGDRTAELQRFNDEDWRRILPLCDHAHLTLPLGVRARHRLPSWVRERVDRNLEHNAIRHKRIMEAHLEIAKVLEAHGIEYVVLKGLTHYPYYCWELSHRPQYDLDLFCPPEAISRANQALRELGYEPFRVLDPSVDHLPPLIRKSGWRPSGNYYDPDMPIAVELHHRFWNLATERFVPGSGTRFWERRVWERDPMMLPALHPEDRLSYAAWHLLRHLVRGDARAYHVYELAQFLHTTAQDTEWWQGWKRSQSTHDAALITFRLASDWFDCSLNPLVETMIHSLPSPLQRWFDIFSLSPLDANEEPNKDELFLHLQLLQKPADCFRVLRRRLFPMHFQAPILDAHVPSPSRALRWKRKLFKLHFIGTRLIHHLWTLLSFTRGCIRWHFARGTQPVPRPQSTLPAKTDSA